MRRKWVSAILSLALTFVCLSVRSDSSAQGRHGRMDALPRLTLWAWERPSDLRDIDPGTTAVAYLALTVRVHGTAVAVPRRQPLVIPVDSRLRMIPVVRVETAPDAVLNDATANGAAQQIVSAVRPGGAALQVDFDAKLSERAWYRIVLTEVRHRMPANLPLSITALASWCSDDRWMQGLPVDEAVPMYFRMEPERWFAPAGLDQFKIREPLCEGSVGVSTTERWPDWYRDQRVYVFSDRGWRVDSIGAVERRVE
jgi:hypothetical protein